MTEALMKDVGGLIGTWQPRKAYHIYPLYLDDLKKFLKERLQIPGSFFSGKKTKVEFIDGKGMDIGVTRKTGAAVETVGIVMKRDLVTMADLKLLMDQISCAEQAYPEIYVVLMGTLTADMESKLDAFIANSGMKNKVTIVKK